MACRFAILVLLFIFVRATLSQDLPVTAKSALLADAETGEILWQRNPDLRCYPASLTKIMTAVLVLERGNLEDWVTVPKEAAFTGESSMALKEGERVQLKDLLNAILVRSANDACVAAAIHLAGSVEKFVEWMNEKAKELGMTNTHFVNPHGLHHPQHFTTARDLLTLTRYALQNPTFRSIVSQREIIVAPTNKSALRRYRNRNKLLELYPGCDGVKTGYTIPAGKCLVASATRNGWQLIAIVLGSQDHFADCATLLDYGSINFFSPLQKRNQPHFHRFSVQNRHSRLSSEPTANFARINDQTATACLPYVCVVGVSVNDDIKFPTFRQRINQFVFVDDHEPLTIKFNEGRLNFNLCAETFQSVLKPYPLTVIVAENS